MSDPVPQFRTIGEVIKEFPGEVVAIRWTCGECAEDTCTVFEAGVDEKIAECQFCDAATAVRRP
ncbi:MAG TPA: hypothetical protein VI756_04715 [Blastocatellia bacterium]